MYKPKQVQTILSTVLSVACLQVAGDRFRSSDGECRLCHDQTSSLRLLEDVIRFRRCRLRASSAETRRNFLLAVGLCRSFSIEAELVRLITGRRCKAYQRDFHRRQPRMDSDDLMIWAAGISRSKKKC